MGAYQQLMSAARSTLKAETKSGPGKAQEQQPTSDVPTKSDSDDRVGADSLKNRFEETKNGDSAFEAAMAAVKALEARKNGSTMAAKVRFAGQQYSVERAKTDSDVRQEARAGKNRLGGACGGLDDIVATIGEKEKNVTSIEKSKLDWDKYTKE